MICEIVSVGTEVVTGDIIDTNAPFIAKELSAVGVNTVYRSAVCDDMDLMCDVLEIAKKRAELIITIGGLGPTYDDITRNAVAKINNKKLYHSEEVEATIKEFFDKLGRTMMPNNLLQAKIIEDATVVENPNGTAPGMILENEGKIFILLPGPPNELIPMVQEQIKPYLATKNDGYIAEKTIKIFGLGESYVESVLYDLMTQTKNPIIAPYAKLGEVHIKITAKGYDKQDALRLLSAYRDKIYSHFEKNIYGEDEDTLPSKAVELLKKHNKKVAFCESCTAGYIAKTLTDVPGASEVFGFGAVTYANEAKMTVVGVSSVSLKQYGAVSEEVAIQMAKGIKSISKADIAISVTGIAGPGGGTEEKPVGLVYSGFVTNNTSMVSKFNLTGNREKIRLLTVKNVMAMIINYLK